MVVVCVPVLIFCLSSVSSRPLGGGEVVRGRGRALPPNLLASHNLLKTSHNYHKEVLPPNLHASHNLLKTSHNYHKEELPQNLLSLHNGYLNDKTYYGVKNSQNTHFSFYDSQAEDKNHFPANPLLKHKPHQKENLHKSEFGDAENSFSLTLP